MVIHHLPGYDRGTKEITRRFAELGYDAVCPNLYSRQAPPSREGLPPNPHHPRHRDRGVRRVPPRAARRGRHPPPPGLRPRHQGDRPAVRRALGFDAVCPNLYSRQAPGADPDDAAATVRALGGITDDQLVDDVGGAAAYLRSLPSSNGKVGVIGYCSGGRQSVLAAAGSTSTRPWTATAPT